MDVQNDLQSISTTNNTYTYHYQFCPGNVRDKTMNDKTALSPFKINKNKDSARLYDPIMI